MIAGGDFLVETDTVVPIVDSASIGAKVLERIGHNDEAEEESRRLVY